MRGSATAAGSRMRNRDPLPGSLSTVTSPPIIWQNRRVMASPSPVPPYLRVVDASAWAKDWNSFAICSGAMPMPVSDTSKVIQSPPLPGPRDTVRPTVPRSVNLLALLRRLSRLCRTLV
jgi:hypothetical protein